MKTLTIVMGLISLVLSVPSIQIGRRKKNTKLLIQGIVALALGTYLMVVGFYSY